MTQDETRELAIKHGLIEQRDDPENSFMVELLAQLKEFATAAYNIGADAEARRIYDAGMVTTGHMRERLSQADAEKCAAVNAMREACLAECKARLHAGDAGVLCAAKAIEKMGQP